MRSILPTVLALSAFAFASDVKSDGAKVHYESYGKGREAIVFVHGWTCDLTFWRGQAPVYSTHRAMLIDLPGHGQSDKPETAYTMDRFARGIEAAMRDVGVDRVVLVGHSMGGPVLQAFYRMYPAKTKALVFVDAAMTPAPGPDSEAFKARVKPFIDSMRGDKYKEVTKGMIEGMFSSNTTPAMRDEIRTKMSATQQHVAVSAMEGMMAQSGPAAGEYHDVPVMAFVAGSTDAAQKEAGFRTAAPNLKRFEAWDGAGHFLMMENPTRFNRALEEFLTSIGGLK